MKGTPRTGEDEDEDDEENYEGKGGGGSHHILVNTLTLCHALHRSNGKNVVGGGVL